MLLLAKITRRTRDFLSNFSRKKTKKSKSKSLRLKKQTNKQKYFDFEMK
jgi:hypothetical protein